MELKPRYITTLIPTSREMTSEQATALIEAIKGMTGAKLVSYSIGVTHIALRFERPETFIDPSTILTDENRTVLIRAYLKDRKVVIQPDKLTEAIAEIKTLVPEKARWNAEVYRAVDRWIDFTFGTGDQ